MTTIRGSVGAPSPGLQLLLERLGRQEITHEHALAESFRHTDLARILGLGSSESRPRVVVEPDRGIFDLALLDDADSAVLYLELTFAAASGWDQRKRQRAFADAAGAARAYIQLGTSFFEIDRELTGSATSSGTCRGYVQSLYWPQGLFLARVATSEPELVIRLVRRISRTDNPRAIATLVEILRALPAAASPSGGRRRATRP